MQGQESAQTCAVTGYALQSRLKTFPLHGRAVRLWALLRIALKPGQESAKTCTVAGYTLQSLLKVLGIVVDHSVLGAAVLSWYMFFAIQAIIMPEVAVARRVTARIKPVCTESDLAQCLSIAMSVIVR